jgi:iron(III) transport system ATP-binding protein
LSFEGVSLFFGQVQAVREVSFELAPGEIVCLLGESGCGKSSLLRLAAGIERPRSGRILLDGRDVGSPRSFEPPERRGVGLMFQDFALFPHMSILDNVAFGLQPLGRAAAREAARAGLLRVGLSALEDAYPHELSGGEQQRAALARAIVPRPSIMLMDEPFSSLDQRLRESVRRETHAVLKETRASCIIVTHDPQEAMGLADRILLMRAGRIVQAGTPREIYESPADIGAARFLCDFNEYVGAVRNGAVATPLGEARAPGLAEGTRVAVLLRPQGFLPAVGEEDGSAAAVREARYLGDIMELDVVFEGFEAPTLVRLPTFSCRIADGSVRLAYDMAHSLVFPAAD